MSIEKNITELLKPFNERRNWVLHYPVYLNTFCLAYHLASTLQNEGLGRESTYRHFLRQDWWGKLNGGLPDFTYKADIEIFFATDDLKEEAKGLGHQIRAFPITNYLNRTIFFLKKNNDNKQKDVCDHENILLITDIPLTAKLFKDSLVNSVENGTEPPDWWRRRFGKSSPKNLRVKHCWEREIFDFFDVVPKIYLFSAPRAWVMAHQDSDPKH